MCGSLGAGCGLEKVALSLHIEHDKFLVRLLGVFGSLVVQGYEFLQFPGVNFVVVHVRNVLSDQGISGLEVRVDCQFPLTLVSLGIAVTHQQVYQPGPDCERETPWVQVELLPVLDLLEVLVENAGVQQQGLRVEYHMETAVMEVSLAGNQQLVVRQGLILDEKFVGVTFFLVYHLHS